MKSLGMRARTVVWAVRSQQVATELRHWHTGKYAVPAPKWAKWSVLERNGFPDGAWVETGTYQGDTSAHLASLGKPVFTIEPSDELFTAAKARLAAFPNVTCLLGTSESTLPSLLSKLSGPVNFWLDGHFSGGETFGASTITPIRTELNVIARYLKHGANACVFVDDFRLFDAHLETRHGYPSRKFLVDWAEDVGLGWHVEQDIFVCRSGS